MFVSEPWHSLINPNDIELPKENSTYSEMLNDHPFLKEIARKFMNKERLRGIRGPEPELLLLPVAPPIASKNKDKLSIKQR